MLYCASVCRPSRLVRLSSAAMPAATLRFVVFTMVFSFSSCFVAALIFSLFLTSARSILHGWLPLEIYISSHFIFYFSFTLVFSLYVFCFAVAVVAMCCRQRRAFNVQEQATATSVEPAAVSNCRTISDVRMSETKRTGPAFSSPLANNEAAPNWRPPATGSSQRHGTTSNGNHYRLQKSSQRHKHREQRQAQQRHQRHYQQEQQQQQSEQECRNYPLRRSRPFTMPSIRIHSPSSSDSYSNLTMSQKSRAAAMISRYYII